MSQVAGGANPENVMFTCDMDGVGPVRVKIESFEGNKQVPFH